MKSLGKIKILSSKQHFLVNMAYNELQQLAGAIHINQTAPI